jgi:serine/threonine protein kinase
MAEVQKSLERYDVLHRIAVGGMAEVFFAKAYGAHGFEKQLAIKRILPELARDPEFEERFIAEAKVAVKLSHTNIVQVFDFGRFGNSLFIAMEFVDGIDLAALLKRHRDANRKLSLSAAFHIAIEIARGLDFAHTHGVIHRDVSPSNILLSRAGEVKIADFGIALAAAQGRAGSGARKIMGKWRYMSPEQARGEELDTRSDLFSAASVMFELFTGEKLFPGDEAEDIIRNIHEMPVPKASAVRPGLPARLDTILLSALSRRPTQRPPRAAVLQRALTELSYESSIVATALDVAEAVNGVAEKSASSRTSLDDIIRKQLGGPGSPDQTVSRNTAVDAGRQTALAEPPIEAVIATPTRGTASRPVTRPPPLPPPIPPSGPPKTGKFRKQPADQPLATIEETGRVTLVSGVDDDGVSVLELDELTIAAIPRAIRGETSGGVSRPVTAPHAAITTGTSMPRMEGPIETSRPQSRITDAFTPTASAIGRKPSASRWILPLLGAMALAAALGVALAKRSAPPVPAPVGVTSHDAATAGTLELDSNPPGAAATIDGAAVGTTPVRIDVAADKPLVVTLELAGHDVYVDDRVQVAPGQTVRIRAILAAAKARLKVTTDPPGATVVVGDRPVGETPITVDDLDAGDRVPVTLSRSGYERAEATVNLKAGAEATLHRVLKAAARQGAIDLFIDDGWAEVYLKGKLIGRAPAKGLKLPVGKHKLRLVNPPSKKSKTLEVVVDADEVRYYRTRI